MLTFPPVLCSSPALILLYQENEKILSSCGLSYKECVKALDDIRGNQKITDREEESRKSVLEEYTVDLTNLARKEQLDPVIGRDKEIDRVIQILSRRKKITLCSLVSRELVRPLLPRDWLIGSLVRMCRSI